MRNHLEESSDSNRKRYNGCIFFETSKSAIIFLQFVLTGIVFALIENMNGFYVTHFAGCAVLFNKDTFYHNVDVKSIYLHDTRRVLHDHIVESEHGWVLQGGVSRASFRRAAASGQTVFTVLSLHINNVYARKEA